MTMVNCFNRLIFGSTYISVHSINTYCYIIVITRRIRTLTILSIATRTVHISKFEKAHYKVKVLISANSVNASDAFM